MTLSSQLNSHTIPQPNLLIACILCTLIRLLCVEIIILYNENWVSSAIVVLASFPDILRQLLCWQVFLILVITHLCNEIKIHHCDF